LIDPCPIGSSLYLRRPEFGYGLRIPKDDEDKPNPSWPSLHPGVARVTSAPGRGY
jgi:hypothetical protein